MAHTMRGIKLVHLAGLLGERTSQTFGTRLLQRSCRPSMVMGRVISGSHGVKSSPRTQLNSFSTWCALLAEHFGLHIFSSIIVLSLCISGILPASISPCEPGTSIQPCSAWVPPPPSTASRFSPQPPFTPSTTPLSPYHATRAVSPRGVLRRMAPSLGLTGSLPHKKCSSLTMPIPTTQPRELSHLCFSLPRFAR
jgi:hypothetical protein